MSNRSVLLPGSLALLLLMLVGLSVGPVDLQFSQLLVADSTDAAVLWQLRMPRVLLAALCGALLAVTGAATQTLFRNPLADPSLIGVSAGAALATVAVVVLGGTMLASHSLLATLGLPLASFSGGVLATLLVMRMASRYRGISMTALLLIGLAINAIAGAFIGALKYVADASALRDASFWLMGRFTEATWWQVLTLCVVLVFVLLLLQRQAGKLNLWLLGAQEAQLLGVDIASTRWLLILCASIGVGVVVAFAGLIGFVGLMVPHLVRIWSGPDNRLLLPQSALVGALLMVLADALSRHLISPSELPVGILTALAGGPFFLLLLHLRYTEAGHA
ncbi:MAG TPA: iron ABC transporter permease [Marinobacterium sp.]|nr:iron ABC transporter permease [Marinobacterium sp.]